MSYEYNLIDAVKNKLLIIKNTRTTSGIPKGNHFSGRCLNKRETYEYDKPRDINLSYKVDKAKVNYGRWDQQWINFFMVKDGDLLHCNELTKECEPTVMVDNKDLINILECIDTMCNDMYSIFAEEKGKDPNYLKNAQLRNSLKIFNSLKK